MRGLNHCPARLPELKTGEVGTRLIEELPNASMNFSGGIPALRPPGGGLLAWATACWICSTIGVAQALQQTRPSLSLSPCNAIKVVLIFRFYVTLQPNLFEGTE